MDLKTKQLKVFLALAETLHFGKAARRLYMSQPALTFQIQSLEASLGAQLFSRDRRHVELTEAGRKFVVTGQRVMSELRYFQESLDSLATDQPLRVVCAPSGEHVILPAVIRRLKETSPQNSVELCSMNPIDYLRALQENRIDVLLMVRRIDAVGVTYQLISKQELYAVVPEGSVFAKRGSISVHEFAAQPIIVTALQHCDQTRPMLERMLAPFGITPSFIEAPVRQSSQEALVAAGMGFTLANEWRLVAPFPGVKMVRFEEPLEPLQLGAAWRSSFESPLLYAFKAALQDVIFHLGKQNKPALVARHPPRAVPITALHQANAPKLVRALG